MNETLAVVPTSAAEQSLMTRRVFSRRVLVGLGVAPVANNATLAWAAEKAGQLADVLVSPEDIIDQEIPVLVPREDHTPVVNPRRISAEATPVNTRYSEKRGFTFSGCESFVAEHTGTWLNTAEDKKYAGIGIITTAEGLEHGTQECCELFRGQEQTVAVGSQTGNLFMWEPALAGEQTGNGEWVRVMTPIEPSPTDIAIKPQSQARTAPVDPATKHGMLIEKVAKGTQTLSELGYRPPAAVLASTQTPGTVVKELSPKICPSRAEDLLDKRDECALMVTGNGDIVDLNHLHAKAAETFDLAVQILFMKMRGDQKPEVSVPYAWGSNSKFKFAFSQEALQTQSVEELAASIMMFETMLMEGITQRYVPEKMPVIDIAASSGLSAEDPSTNSMGILGMLKLMRRHNLFDPLSKALAKIQQAHQNTSMDKVSKILEETFVEYREKLAKLVVFNNALEHGVTPVNEPTRVNLPLGFYPLVPTKVDDRFATRPTHIDYCGAGYTPNSPQIDIKPTNVPAMRLTLRHKMNQWLPQAGEA